MLLADQIRQSRREKKILLMTHLVLGSPSFAVNREVVRQMVENGVDLIELQIPFSEPMADGPTIIEANQQAIADGVRVRDCLAFAAEMAAEYPVPFLFMTYCNILFKYGIKYGIEDFLKKTKEIGLKGLIVPDLPPEEGEDYLRLCREYGLAPIQIFAPTSTDERMRFLSDRGDGFIYCVARRGVTGRQTDFDQDFDRYLERCRAATDLSLAVGFGIGSPQDVELLAGRADIAVIGTATIRLVREKGPEAVGPFIAGLRA